jgi:hypothetical protein
VAAAGDGGGGGRGGVAWEDGSGVSIAAHAPVSNAEVRYSQDSTTITLAANKQVCVCVGGGCAVQEKVMDCQGGLGRQHPGAKGETVCQGRRDIGEGT